MHRHCIFWKIDRRLKKNSTTGKCSEVNGLKSSGILYLWEGLDTCFHILVLAKISTVQNNFSGWRCRDEWNYCRKLEDPLNSHFHQAGLSPRCQIFLFDTPRAFQRAFPILFVIMANLPDRNLLGFCVCGFDSRTKIDFGFVSRLVSGAYYSINVTSMEE